MCILELQSPDIIFQNWGKSQYFQWFLVFQFYLNKSVCVCRGGGGGGGGFPGGSTSKESACNAGNMGSIPGLGRSPGEGKDYPLQYSGLETSMDYSPWGLKESDTSEQFSL